LLSFYNPVFIALGLMLLLMLYLSLSMTAKRGLEASLRESNYKYNIVAWLEELAKSIQELQGFWKTQPSFGENRSTVGGISGSKDRPFQRIETPVLEPDCFQIIDHCSDVVCWRAVVD